jgi:hypothetical protein
MGFSFGDFSNGFSSIFGTLTKPAQQVTQSVAGVANNAVGTIGNVLDSMMMPMMIVGGIVLVIMVMK